MGLFVFAVILVLIALGVGKAMSKEKKIIGIGVVVLGVIIAVVLLVSSCFKKVPTGHTGIVTVFGEVKDQTYEAGLHFTAPWVQLVNMDNRTQKDTLTLSCFSKDIQEVSMVLDVNYQISKTSAQQIYREIGTDYYNIIVVPRVQEIVKQYTALYTAEGIITNRAELADGVETALRKELALYNIELVTSAISNIDFTDAFTNAVEEKQVAEQQKLKAATDKEKAIIDAEASAEVVKLNAQAAAEAKITAAEAEAKANELLQKSLTDMVIRKMFYDKWDGKLPTVSGGNGVMLDVDSLINKEQ